MDSSDSLQIDEHLARLLAAYDQGIDGGDGHAPTIGVTHVGIPARPALPGEEPVKPLSGIRANEGSLGDLLPDNGRIPPTPEIRVSPTTPAPPGGSHRIGRFELRRQLGKGGCGIVFLAFDPKLEREVALKIPRPEMLLSPDARRRLVREALAAAEFDHPNLVPVYETGEIGPICYIATAFCPGQTLGEWLDKQAFPVPVRQAARLVAIVAEAVQHAHDRGVLHRDLKPNNVLLQSTKEDPQEQEAPPGSCLLRGEHFIPRVVDFGLAKLLERGGPSDTNTRQILGTPKYMAPEQAMARHDDVGPTADVYALGVILYEMLAGCAPYEGATDVEVLRQSIEGHLKYPRHIRSEIPRDLEAICLKAMDRNPAGRYRTAIDLADDLRRFLEGKPTLARPLKWTGRAVKWLRRNDQVVALGVVTTIAAILLAVGGWYVRQTQQLKNDQDRVAREQAERTQADQRRDYANRVRDSFLAWRSGNYAAATEARDAAGRLARVGGEPLDFPLRYLTSLMLAERLHLACPAGAITALAVSADGTRLASGHADGTIALWDRASAQQLSSVNAYESPVRSLAFALKGSRLVSFDSPGPSGGHLMSWTITTEGALSAISIPSGSLPTSILCSVISGDGERIYIGTREGALVAIQLRDFAIAHQLLKPRTVPITAMTINSGGRELVVGTGSGELIRYTNDLVEIEKVAAHQQGISRLASGFPMGGFASVSSDGSITLFSPLGFNVLLPRRDRSPWLAGLPRGGIVAGDGPGRIVIAADQHYSIETGDAGSITCTASTRDGTTLYTGAEDGIIRSWLLSEDGDKRGARSGIEVLAVAIHPDGKRVMVNTPAGIQEYTGKSRANAAANPTARFVDLRIPQEGPCQGVELRDHAVVIRDPLSPTLRRVIRLRLPDEAAPQSACLSRDGARVAAGDDRGRVHVWSLKDGSLLTTVDCGHRSPVRRVALSADGKLVAALAPSGVLVSSVDDQTSRATIAGDEQAVFRFLPDGSRLIIADRSGVVRLNSVVDGSEEAAFFGHVGRITGLGVSADGRTIVSGAASGEVKFWDARTGQEVMSFRRHSVQVTQIEFSQNGKLLVTGGKGQLAFWESDE
jgi:WD40 repeat protein